jgi:hypothetical protein
MLKEWIKLTTADCEVIKFANNLNIYPIFKNGRSSLTIYAGHNNLPILKNKEISVLKNIAIYVRDPIERFVSGVHTFFYLNQLKINNETLKKIDNFEIVDRHFMPQSFWLLHLYKFYRGNVILKDVKEVYDLVPLRDGPWTKNPIPWKKLTKQQEEQITALTYKKFTDIDYHIINKYMNKEVLLFKIIKEIKNALS